MQLSLVSEMGNCLYQDLSLKKFLIYDPVLDLTINSQLEVSIFQSSLCQMEILEWLPQSKTMLKTGLVLPGGAYPIRN